MLLAISTPADNDRGPLYMDQVLAALCEGNSRRLPVSLEFGRWNNAVRLFCRFPDELRGVVEGQLYAQYPDCRLEQVPEDAVAFPEDSRVSTAELRLCPDLFPCKRYAQFEDALNRSLADPITGILIALAPTSNASLRGQVSIVLRPARGRLRARRHHCLHKLASPFFRARPGLSRLYLHLALSRWLPIRMLAAFFCRLVGGEAKSSPDAALTTSSSRVHDREEDLQAAADKLGRPLFEARILLRVTASPEAAAQARAKIREIAAAFGQFSSRLASFHATRTRRREWNLFPESAFLLSAEEVATLWHPPTSAARAPTMPTVESREREPPITLPTPAQHDDLAVLGVATFRGRQQRFGILPDDRLRHLAIVGKTGMGKTTLLQQLILSDIRAGRGVGLIDPHGDLAEVVLAAIPSQRTNDVVLLDAADRDHPLAFNLLACGRPEQRPLVVSGILSAFKKLYGDFWGPRLEHILRNALLALVEVPGSSLLSVVTLLTNAKERQRTVARLSDPVVRSFWEHEFAALPPKLQAEATAPILNKIGAFISSPLLRNIVGQEKNTLDLRRLMDQGGILIVNLSKGRLGDDASALLGSFMVTAIQLAAMSRADVPEENRREFYLYVDEFQNYATESFATILSEARKYRLSLTIANQYLGQLDEDTLAALFGNVGTLVCFAVGVNDAEILAQQLGGDLTPQDLLQLPRHTAYIRLLIHGLPSRPFSMKTLPPSQQARDPRRAEIIRRTSRQRYARPADAVARDIRTILAY